MRIFISFLQAKEQHPIAAYSFWEYYIKNGIEEAGHQWIECEEVDWAKGLVNQYSESFNYWKTFTWEKTVAYIKKHQPDLFLSYLYPQQIDEQAISEIKKMGIPCVNFFCDHVRMFKEVPKEFKIFDQNWVPEYKALKMYKKANLKHINLPMPMWVNPRFRTLPINENENISFIGSKDIQRHLFFEKLLKEYPQIKIDIYGSGWTDDQLSIFNPNFSMIDRIKNQVNFLSKNGIGPFMNKLKQKSYNPTLSKSLVKLLKGRPNFEDYIITTRESSITLGINRYPSFNYPLNNPDTYSRLRDIEAPMLGACYVTEWTEGLDEMYEIGKEIEVFTTATELSYTIIKLEKDKVKRDKIRIDGQKKALKQHSIMRSLDIIIKNL